MSKGKFVSRFRFSVALIAMVSGLVFSLGPTLAEPVVLISIDGMNRAFYQSTEFPTPELQRMAAEGAGAERLIPVFPSLTYPDHAALVTGCRPARSGVCTNVIEGRSEWYWESRYLQSPAIWQVASEKGLRVALLGWPTTVGAQVEYNIPEVFYAPGTGPETTEERIAKYSTPGTMELLGVKVPRDFPTWDLYMTEACEKLLSEDRVDLLLVHLIQVDQAQHKYGPDDLRVVECAARVDELVGRIRRAAGPKALVAVVGDHGFLPYRENIYPKQMLKQGGFTTGVSAHGAGGSAIIYGGGPEVEEYFRAQSGGRYRIVPREELDRLGTLPGANFALAALGSASFSYLEHGPPEEDRTRGQHGHLPEMVPTGWVMTGPGIEPGADLGVCRIIDVAPTLAKRLGIEFSQAEGTDKLSNP